MNVLLVVKYQRLKRYSLWVTSDKTGRWKILLIQTLLFMQLVFGTKSIYFMWGTLQPFISKVTLNELGWTIITATNEVFY